MEPLRVALPLGIGDCHWAVQKFRGLSKHHDGRPIHAFVNESQHHKTWNYLRLAAPVAHAEMSRFAPYDINREMDDYKAARWSTLQGCAGWKGFDYLLVPNGHLERGLRIEEYLPEVETDYSYDLLFIDGERTWMQHAGLEDRVLVYLSGVGPNREFHSHTWSQHHWVELLRDLSAIGHMPVIIGANTDDDLRYYAQVAQLLGPHCPHVNMVGKTTHAQVMCLIKHAKLWIGLNSGLGIVSASQGTPTLMFWSDNRYAHVRRVHPEKALHHKMQRSWLSEEQLTTYRTISYGSPEASPAHAFYLIQELL